MKFPRHIVLDIKSHLVVNAPKYWVYRYLLAFKQSSFIFENFTFQKKFLIKKENLLLSKMLKNQKKHTLRYSLSNPSLFFNTEKKNFYKSAFAPRLKVKHRLLFSKHISKEVFDFLQKDLTKFDAKYFNRIFRDFKFAPSLTAFKSTSPLSLFDINFLRKERIYTKLKYSRVPQYDIVAGGSAALFAGFLGFLICEKFGFELVDSGDFYILFMYLVFLFFTLRVFLRLIDETAPSWSPFSPRWLMHYAHLVAALLIKSFKNYKL